MAVFIHQVCLPGVSMETGSLASVCCVWQHCAMHWHSQKQGLFHWNMLALQCAKLLTARVVSTKPLDLACLQLLLGYLPPDASQWEGILTAKRKAYNQFCKVGTRWQAHATSMLTGPYQASQLLSG